MFERDIHAALATFTLLVVPHRMAMEKSAARRILTRYAHVIARIEQAGVGQIFGVAPIDRQFACAHFAAVIQHLLHAGMQLDFVLQGGDALTEKIQPLGGNGSRHVNVRLAIEARPVDAINLVEVGFRGRTQRPPLFQPIPAAVNHVVGLGLRQHALIHQPLRIQGTACWDGPECGDTSAAG